MGDFLKQRLRTGHTWVASVASVVALAFSGYNFSQLQEDPRIDLTLPKVLRLEYDPTGISLFRQPTVSTRFDTEDVEMVTDLRLTMRRTGGKSPSPDFYWARTVKWLFKPGAGGKGEIVYEFLADPAPFTVTQTQPQQHSIRFRTNNWNLSPGTYEGTLSVHRASTRAPVEQTFCLVLRPPDVTLLKNPSQEGWYEFRRDVPGHEEGGCYHWFG
ncbi:hypothetical protein AB0D45_22840 [Streptomyces sp. NPDC048352]|uniref:hypothetical protein n=1 Tax=Streptomyces sp. NPDC048352 TaxID=3154718 RepID=UPI00341E7D02